MIKKSVIVVAFLICILIFSQVLAQETEEEKVGKAYNWLAKEVKPWSDLTIKQHAFSLLALKCNESYADSGNKSLYAKSFTTSKFRCWGLKDKPQSESQCLVTETALAKLALDDLGDDTTKAKEWLLNKSIFFRDIDWYLQLDVDRGFKVKCIIGYDGTESTVNISENKSLFGLSDNTCFTLYPAAEPYWLKIKQECYEKPFKIKCESESPEFRVAFLYKKGNVWSVPTKTEHAASGSEIEVAIESYCLANPSNPNACDYEGTAWATYALKKTEAHEFSKFIPYLVIKAEDNKGIFPEAFLYLIAESYGTQIEKMQNSQGFWKTDNTKHGQFYDTALGGMTLQGDLGSASGGARHYLTHAVGFKTEGKYRYWLCGESGCEKIRDTAFLLWVFWPELCPSGLGLDCEAQGYRCRDEAEGCQADEEQVNFACAENLICCKKFGVPEDCTDAGGNCKISCSTDEFKIKDITCPEYKDCCKKYSDAESCAEFGATSCDENEKCSDEEVIIANGEKCCLGSCVPSDASERYCEDIGEECLVGKICINTISWMEIEFTETKDTTRCCVDDSVKCVQDKECEDIGEECKTGTKCYNGDIEETKDVEECCTGECLKTCAQENGMICKENEKCTETEIKAWNSETNAITSKCCKGECKKPSLWWLWIIILIVIVFLLFYFFKLKKKKLKKKPELPGMPTMQPMRPRPMPMMPGQTPRIMGRPGMPLKPVQARGISTARPIIAPKPIMPIRKLAKPKGKTEEELEKTLKKLKGMTKK